MIAFRNTLGGLMWVAESRAEEYKARGYQEIKKAAPEPTKAVEETAEKPKEETSIKKPVSKKKK